MLVNGASRLIGDAFVNKIQITTISAPTSSGGTTYSQGTSGQVLKTNGTSVYWATDNTNPGTVTSVQVQATSPVVSSVNTAQSSSLNTTISLANNYGDTKNPYASKTKNYVLASPSNANGAPSFRALVAADIPNLSWNKITSDKPTTLSGYGITDAKIANGVITLGSNTITPKTVQTAVTKPTATTNKWVSAIGQSANGNLDVSYASLDTSGTWSGNATTATKATQDSDGNTINTTYLKLTGGNMTGNLLNSTSIWAGKNADGTQPSAGECDIGTGGPAGMIYFFSGGTSRGIHSFNSSSTSKRVLTIDSNNNVSLDGNADTATTGKYLWSGFANPVYGTNRLEYFNANGTQATPTANATAYPTSDWYHFLRMNHGNSQGYYVEIASHFHSDNMYWRRVAAGTAYNWKKVAWADGTNSSGTWGISITGNAATATKATQDQNGYNLNDSYRKEFVSAIDLSSLNVNTWYPVVAILPASGFRRLSCVVHLNSGTVPSWSVHDNGFTAVVDLLATASGWGTTSARTILLQNNQTYINDTSNPPVGYTQFMDSSSACFYLRGGGKYFLKTDWIASWGIITSSITYGSQTVAPVTTYPNFSGLSVTLVDMNGYSSFTRAYGAVWNDYAEYRKDNPNEIQESGRCVKELGNGALALTTKRLERGCEIISDTFGFAIGQDEENGYNTPIASNGRVLAYPYESIEEFAHHIGWPVCSGPNGTVSIMTEEEEEKYPSRIIGTISEIPTYKTWGTGNVEIDGRIWIRIR